MELEFKMQPLNRTTVRTTHRNHKTFTSAREQGTPWCTPNLTRKAKMGRSAEQVEGGENGPKLKEAFVAP